MEPRDRACFNCEASTRIKIPSVGATSESDYMGFCVCRQKLSDHSRHVLSLWHTCAWHSDSVSRDDRYPDWRKSIDKKGNKQ
ncbi:hypothetical protein LCGC14_2908380 [marine sediment metagenome]|uniref:Uncharacterized protein n=1 Tax=marine sediment metagenome TaxID=412755 RepID=A0A0F8XSS1_9ZZZZ